MCGRYVIYTADDLSAMRDIVAEAERRAQEKEPGCSVKTGEIFPTDVVPVQIAAAATDTAVAVSQALAPTPTPTPIPAPGAAAASPLAIAQSQLEAWPMSWGFPGFKGKGVIFNARIEQALEKPFWRESLLQRRCVVPTSGFYEWQHGGPDDKRRYHFTLPGEPVLYLAGIYKAFDDEHQPTHHRCPRQRFSILTTAPNASVRDIHNRMPVVLRGHELEEWLQGDPLAFADRSAVLLERA
ncbi:MAG: SOS response-associated peptidase [Coriobacteriales bacterium]|jgi:putative SOS response-associated peptidase YedK|nr:SOS response-associated peptidase [Coriobacteriales bacterium]